MRQISHDEFIGRTYGKWNVLGPGRWVDGKPQIRCQCSCGQIKFVSRDSISRGLSTGCRKCSGMKGKNNPAYRGTENIPGNYWGILQKSAKVRNLPVNIDIEFLDRLIKAQDFKCALSGLPISFDGGKKGKNWTASVDRIDSSKGYEKDNVQFVHKDVNLMKNNFSQDRFVEICGRVTVRVLQGK